MERTEKLTYVRIGLFVIIYTSIVSVDNVCKILIISRLNLSLGCRTQLKHSLETQNSCKVDRYYW